MSAPDRPEDVDAAPRGGAPGPVAGEPVVRRHRGDFHWDDVDLLRYKQEGEAPFRDVTRQVLFEGGEIPAQLRYFEVAPGGYTTLERHEHVHNVMVIRGSGHCRVGEEVHGLALHDLVRVPPMTWHQFHAAPGEPLGFLCLVPAQRDRPQLPGEEERAALLMPPRGEVGSAGSSPNHAGKRIAVRVLQRCDPTGRMQHAVGRAWHFSPTARVSAARVLGIRLRSNEVYTMYPAALTPAALWSMTKEAIAAWSDDFAPSMGAAIAYYTAFSIAPLIVIVLAIAGLFYGQEAAGGYLYSQLADLFGRDGAKAVQDMVASAKDPGEGIVATLTGLALLAVGATTVFAELQSSLDRIWKAPAVKRPEGLWGLLRSRVLSLGLVVSIGFVMLASLVISAGLAVLSSWWGGAFENLQWLLQIVNFAVGFAVATVLFALMYKILPRVSIGWRDVWIGALVTALLFSVGKFLVGLYLGKSSVASSFGAAGSLAVLLVWVYYSAQIFLLGAEFTWVYAHRYGSRVGRPMPASVKETLATTTQPDGAAPAKPRARAQDHRGPAPTAGEGAAHVLAATAATAGLALVVGAFLGGVANRVQGR